MSRKAWLNLYVSLTMLAGVLALGQSLLSWPAVSLSSWELVGFILLAAVLDVMVVPVVGGGGMSASLAVFFAGILLFGGGPTAWVAALAVLWSEGVVRRKPLLRIGYNVSHSVLSLLSVGWVYRTLGGVAGKTDLTSLHSVEIVLITALLLWLSETLWLSVAVALERGGGLWRRVRSTLGPGLAWDGALASVGVLLALLWQNRTELLGASGVGGTIFLATTVLIPCGLLYYAYRLQGSLRQVYTNSLQTLSALLEAKVEGGQPGHGINVAELASQLAEAFELSPRQVEQIRYAGYLHDIGKVGVPASQLHRHWDEAAGEAESVRLHASIGANILVPIHFLKPAAEIIRSHHERWDGLGYPDKLRRTDIPLGARLLSVANAYIGMIRSAHSPLTPSQALLRLRRASGSRFDPEVVEVLARILLEDGEVLGPVTAEAKLIRS